MAASMKIYIKADDSVQLQKALMNISQFGNVEEKFSSQELNFLPTNDEVLDTACDILDELGVSYELV